MPKKLTRTIYIDGKPYTEKQLRKAIKAGETTLAIVAIMSGRSWDADTPCDIAAVLERAGYTIKGIDD
jgi:hypothetical protein